MKDNHLDQSVLALFTGSDTYCRHSLTPHIIYTAGAKYVADAASAYWLLDEIALSQRSYRDVTVEDFQVWTLKVNVDRSATLTCDDGNGNVVFTKAIEYTDFPQDGITLWFTGNTILRSQPNTDLPGLPAFTRAGLFSFQQQGVRP